MGSTAVFGGTAHRSPALLIGYQAVRLFTFSGFTPAMFLK